MKTNDQIGNYRKIKIEMEQKSLEKLRMIKVAFYEVRHLSYI